MLAIPARELLHKIKTALTPYYDAREVEAIGLELLRHFAGLDRATISMNQTVAPGNQKTALLDDAIERLKKQEPLQHVLGETVFYDLVFKTDHRALVPRPETEELVDWIIKDQKGRPIRLVDIGTGTGCIPIVLAKHLPQAKVTAIDVSSEALKLAQENAQLNSANIDFLQLDILEEELPGVYDVIVSNPHYIPNSDKAQMATNVLDFEPGLALFVPDEDPLRFYKRIAALAGHQLTAGGCLFFEIHEAYGTELKWLLIENGFKSVELRQDLQGKDRMIKAIKA